MNSKMTYRALINKSIYTVNVGSVFLSQILTDKYECKLILKELKDITEEDLKVYYQMEDVDIYEYGVGNAVETLVNQESLFKVEQIDFIRSKGYAIGIPKEYYVTK